MKELEASGVTEAGKAIALAVVLTVATVYVPLVSAGLIFLLPLPIAYVTKRRGAQTGIAASIGAGILTGLLTGPLNGLLAVFLAGLAGVMLGTALARGWRSSTSLLSLTAVMSVGLAGIGGATWVLTGMDAEQVREMVDRSLASASDLYVAAGMEQASVDAAAEQVREVVELVPYLLPSILGVIALLFAGAALALAGLVFPRLGEETRAGGSFAAFRLHWGAAYGFIIGLGMLVGSSWAGSAAGTVELIGLNLFLFFQMLYFVQGLAVVHWYVLNRKMTGVGRAAVYGVAVLGQFALTLTSWAGLLDTWFDYRKRLAARKPASEVSRPPGGRDDEWKE